MHLAAADFFAQRIQDNLSNRDKLLSMPAAEFIAEVQSRKNTPEIEPVHYRLPDGYVIDICRDVRNANNDYLIDREMQRTQNYTGIDNYVSSNSA